MQAAKRKIPEEYFNDLFLGFAHKRQAERVTLPLPIRWRSAGETRAETVDPRILGHLHGVNALDEISLPQRFVEIIALRHVAAAEREEVGLSLRLWPWLLAGACGIKKTSRSSGTDAVIGVSRRRAASRIWILPCARTQPMRAVLNFSIFSDS